MEHAEAMTTIAYIRSHLPRGLAPVLAACIASAAPGAEPLPVRAPDPITDPDIGAMMSGLRSANFHQRERASIDLQGMVEQGRLSEKDVLELAARPDITPEQRLRLLSKAKVAFTRTERAGMGVSFHEVLGMGARLTLVVEGFPATEVLRPDDVIESIAGVAMASPNRRSRADLDMRLRAAVISHDPGETVRVVFRRSPASTPGGLPENVNLRANAPRSILAPEDVEAWPAHEAQVRLGAFGGLGSTAPISPIELDAAWMLRVARIIGPDHAGWPIVAVGRLIGAPLALEQLPEPLHDNQVSGAAQRPVLRDRVFAAQRNQINAQARLELGRRIQMQRDAEEGAPEPPSTQPDGSTQLTDQSGAVHLDAVADLDAELRLIERRLARAAAEGAPMEIQEQLRRRHADLSAQLRALVGASR